MKATYKYLHIVAVIALTGCATTSMNYESPAGPRYAGNPNATIRQSRHGDRLRIVSFNIAFARHVDSAIVVLNSDSALRAADVILLQEMDDVGTRRVAEAVGMSYVYYPATLHPRTRRDMGNAVLSRWPILADAKVLLPHISRYRRTRRSATAVTIRVVDRDVRVYSTHLGTMADIGPGSRRDQLRAILEDAAPYRRVIIGGDMNNGSVGRLARDAGYYWPTEKGPPTMHGLTWDHIFFRGLAPPETAAVGTVVDNHHASDHRPIWATAILH